MHIDERRQGNRLGSDKMQIFDDYRKPGPIPADYYEMAGLLSKALVGHRFSFQLIMLPYF